MLTVYTSQFRYNGPHRLDTTAKGSNIFGPTWDIVQKIKSKRINEEIYSAYYKAQMLESYYNNPKYWTNLLSLDKIVLVCYCNSNVFCHRHLLKSYLMDLGAIDGGEISTDHVFS